MHKREQHSDYHGQHETQRKVIIDEFGDQQSRQQRAEKTETHRNRQREILYRTAEPAEPVVRHNHEIGQETERYRGVDVRKRRGKGQGIAAHRLHWYSDELEHRADENINARGEDVRAEEIVIVRAVLFGKTRKHPHYRFDEQLKFSGYGFEARNKENPDYRGKNQKHESHGYCGNQGRIHFQPEQTYRILFVQNGVLHHIRYVLR